jgi:hypothetical protein
MRFDTRECGQIQGRQNINKIVDSVVLTGFGKSKPFHSVAEHPASHFNYEVILFLRITSSINVGFPTLLGELGRENDFLP